MPYLVQLESSSDSEVNVPRKHQHCALPSPINESPSYVAIPAMTNRTWPSLFHLWNDWYKEYLYSERNEPFLMVRFEDMLFRPRAVVNQIRQCVGASWVEENTFTYMVDHSKWEHIRFHGPQSNMISAIRSRTDEPVWLQISRLISFVLSFRRFREFAGRNKM
jgi:hypothetical protein